MSTIVLSCRCGAVTGELRDLRPRTAIRLRCYCDDCQTWAFWLGRPDDVLDASGGTEMIQTTPSRVAITKGRDRLRLGRLSPKGPYRWFSGCCRTPVANMLPQRRLALANLVRPFVRAEDAALEAHLGIVHGVNGRFATGPLPPGAHPRARAGTLVGVLGRALGGSLRGHHRPSPFYGDDGRPAVPPELVPLEERRKHHEAAARRTRMS